MHIINVNDQIEQIYLSSLLRCGFLKKRKNDRTITVKHSIKP